jgi:two-component system, sensor histidine kinase and response regulator
MKQLLHYQVEQRHIFDNIKFQISQNLDFSNIVQTTIERVRSLLSLDRLIIYQLSIAQESIAQEIFTEQHEQCRIVDRVTYETRSATGISSILNFQQASYEDNSFKCWAKYRQGFTLAVNDIDCANLAVELKELMRQLQVKSKVVVPINLRGKLWGLLIAHQCHHPRIWSYDETQFLRQIAEYLAIAAYRHQSYEDLHTQKELLEKQVKNQAQQIEDALVAARIASQSKHEFIGNISHELRTPLTRVIGLSGTLLHWSLEKGRIPLPIEKQQQYLKTIQESGKHLLKLINNILEFSEVQSGKHLLNTEYISLLELCQRVTDSLQGKAIDLELNLTLDFQLIPETDYFYGDRARLEEILLNLLDNALKFTLPQGNIFLRIWQEEKQIIFEIEDTGIGIAEQQLPLLFETFKPLENYRQRIHDGAGLGLALTKHLVELHGGNIEVESTLGEGSVFRVYLPIVKEEHSVISNSISTTELIASNSKKVILITQDEEIATFICQLLTAAGYKVVWLIDTMTAINQIDFLEPQIVILDRDNLEIEIPDVTDTIQAIEKIKTTKTILLYSQQMKTHEWEHFLENGISDRLLKSMELPQLLAKIEALI